MSYQDITQYNAACFTPGRPYGITSITIHWWGDPSDGPTFDGVIRTFTSGARGTSAHYVVEDGRVACLVAPGDRAWACGDGVGVGSGGNDTSISIECNPPPERRGLPDGRRTGAGPARRVRGLAHVPAQPLVQHPVPRYL